ncbi:YhcN/YlaJ family sporulation lipoprotein [Bacillus sp. JJ1764]|uniref:YhcN/YlaJ family sporulation lipoprotein n=1 Tax=Bacillus sp. JJ1764 TaxID=3122964 RepID=UPI002FFEA5E5
MKFRLIIITALFFTISLTACNNNNDNAASRNGDKTELTRVKYNIPNHGGPAISSVDVSDKKLDRNANHINNELVNNPHHTIQSRMRVADHAAKKIANLPGVERANVIVSDEKAYVAAKMDRNTNNQLSNQVRKQISKTVKSVDKDIDHIYISANPDFYDRLDTYANKIRNGKGKPSSEFINEFTKTMQRVFPESK